MEAIINLHIVIILVFIIDQARLLNRGQALHFLLIYLGAVLLSLFSEVMEMQQKEEWALLILIFQFSLILLYATSSFLYLKSLFQSITLKEIFTRYSPAVCFIIQHTYLVFAGHVTFYESYIFRVELFAIIAILFYYGIQQLLIIHKFRVHSPKDARLDYLWKYAIGFLLMHTAQLILDISATEGEKSRYVQIMNNSLSVMMTIYLAYLLHKAGVIMAKIRSQNSAELAEKKTLEDNKFEKIFQSINQLIREEKLYLNPNISLELLSKKLKVNTKYISLAINQVYGKSFSKYINVLRVEAFIEEVHKEENQHLNLLSVALSCGFPSKSSFNRIFKEFKGVSPSEYLNQTYHSSSNT